MTYENAGVASPAAAELPESFAVGCRNIEVVPAITKPPDQRSTARRDEPVSTLAPTEPPEPTTAGFRSTSVAGVTLHRLPYVDDPRGLLTFGEIGPQVPFEVKRYFLVFGVSSAEIRGEHAHRELHQFLICVHGCCHLTADDGHNCEDFRLDSPCIGVHLPPMVWGVQHKYSQDGVLLVLASAKYDPADYIREYSEFLRLVKGRE